MTYDGPLSVLCDTQSIPILLFIGRHGNCTKSNIYRGVSRTSNTPKRLESLAGSGLIEMEPVGDGRATRVLLTDMGVRVVNLLRDIESIMSEQ